MSSRRRARSSCQVRLDSDVATLPGPCERCCLQNVSGRLLACAEFFALSAIAADTAELQPGPWLRTATLAQVRVASTLHTRPPPAAACADRSRSRYLPTLPYLAGVGVQWGVTVLSHRKSSDDHIKLAALQQPSGTPAAVEFPDDRLIIRVPNGPGGCVGGRSG